MSTGGVQPPREPEKGSAPKGLPSSKLAEQVPSKGGRLLEAPIAEELLHSAPLKWEAAEFVLGINDV